ncbi:hypothetical protein [Streptomyces sp. FH025]|uniref:hypothetical protein n=1 Tax=Streptomyces sp. FH025 TaxID=2815937 RepID=UPI001A9FD9B5|nr:hypothetical protein [Streptomyces sp. FH025]MBO1416575.1 hypothetical protein [Streptomyces sp. FH025]
MEEKRGFKSVLSSGPRVTALIVLLDVAVIACAMAFVPATYVFPAVGAPLIVVNTFVFRRALDRKKD